MGFHNVLNYHELQNVVYKKQTCQSQFKYGEKNSLDEICAEPTAKSEDLHDVSYWSRSDFSEKGVHDNMTYRPLKESPQTDLSDNVS